MKYLLKAFFLLVTIGLAATVEARLIPGTTVALRGSNGKFISSENGNARMICNRNSIGGWEKFKVVSAGSGKIGLRGSNGKFVSSENGNAAMICNRSSIKGWEAFTVIKAGGGRIALKGSNGKYVSSENGSKAITCNRNSDSSLWEWFTPVVVSKGQTINGDKEIAAAGSTWTGLKNAINKAGAGGTVTLTGNYTLNSTITIDKPGLTIRGGRLTLSNSSNWKSIFRVKDVAGVTIDDVEMAGPWTWCSGGFTGLITLDGSEDFTVKNSMLRRHQMGVFMLFKPSNGIRIINCTFDDCETASLFLRDVVRIDSSNKVMAAHHGGYHEFLNNTVKGTRLLSGFRFDAGNDGTYADKNYPQQNNPLRTQVDKKHTKLWSEQGYRSKIRGCTIGNGTGTQGIKQFGVGLAFMDGMYIGGPNASDRNVISMGSNANNNFSHTIHTEHTSQNHIFENNILNTRHRLGIFLGGFTDHDSPDGADVGTRNIVIKNNQFRGNWASTAKGISGYHFHNATITGNSFTGYNSGNHFKVWSVLSNGYKTVGWNSPAIKK